MGECYKENVQVFIKYARDSSDEDNRLIQGCVCANLRLRRIRKD